MRSGRDEAAAVEPAGVRSLIWFLTALLAVMLTGAQPAAAEDGPAGCFPVCASGNGGSVDVEVVRGASEQVPGRGDGTTGKAPGRTSWTVIDEWITPACSANGLHGLDAMCAAALSCPADNLLRFWVWHQVTHWEAGPPERVTHVEDWQREPGSYCLGPDDPGITPIGIVIAEVQSGFQSLPLPRATPEINPAPSTLVNIATRLSAGSAEPVVLTTEPLAGIVVTVTARPVEWVWTYGDGVTERTTVPTTEHEYSRARRFGASVRVTWEGSFTLPGSSESFPIRTPAYVQSAVTGVDVREARTELVRD